MHWASKAVGVVIVCSLLLTLLFYLMADDEHIKTTSVNRESHDGLHLQIMNDINTKQLNTRLENKVESIPSQSSLKDTLQTRQDRLMKECKGLSINASEYRKSQLDHIIVNDKYKILYCYVPKVACTNLKRIFLILSGNIKVNDPLKLGHEEVHLNLNKELIYLNRLSPSEIKYRVQRYTKAIFVREPLERILSAYRNKFVHDGNAFKNKYGKRIIKMFRKNPSNKSLETGHDVKFAEFVNYILHRKTQEALGLNEHWETYYNLCSPCHIQYNFIGNYETLNEDVDMLLKEISADGMVEFPKRNETYKTAKTEDTMEMFYRDIDPTKILKLQEIYSLDYSLFGYQLPESLRNWVNKTMPISP